MKNFILSMIALLIAFSMTAQETNTIKDNAEKNGWEVFVHEADELVGNKEYGSFVYSNGKCSIVIWTDENRKFKIITDKSTFNYKVTKWSFQYKNIMVALVGLYDIDGNLISKEKGYFDCEHLNNAISMKDNFAHNVGKTVIPFLVNEKGFVRIVAPLSSGESFDIKIPCFNN